MHLDEAQDGGPVLVGHPVGRLDLAAGGDVRLEQRRTARRGGRSCVGRRPASAHAATRMGSRASGSVIATASSRRSRRRRPRRAPARRRRTRRRGPQPAVRAVPGDEPVQRGEHEGRGRERRSTASKAPMSRRPPRSPCGSGASYASRRREMRSARRSGRASATRARRRSARSTSSVTTLDMGRGRARSRRSTASPLGRRRCRRGGDRRQCGVAAASNRVAVRSTIDHRTSSFEVDVRVQARALDVERASDVAHARPRVATLAEQRAGDGLDLASSCRLRTTAPSTPNDRLVRSSLRHDAARGQDDRRRAARLTPR